MKNIDKKVVNDFGEEWSAFKQSDIEKKDLESAWEQYFSIFPFNELPDNAIGFDLGCGSGRWAMFTSPKVGHLHCIDASEKALSVAKENLSELDEITFHHGSVSDGILDDNSQDFGYCLGVLHHIPDTLDGLKSCSKMLKSGAPFLLYLYYNFENRSVLFKAIWRISNIFRWFISKFPSPLKKLTTFLIAIVVYFPLARISLFIERIGFNPHFVPLSDYRKKKFKFMATDSLDRFGTRLEKRFSKSDIINMLEEAGFINVRFSSSQPYWVCISYRR